MGDLLSSLFVGYTLFWGYAYLHNSPWQPVAVGYLIPILVYRFSTLWNRRNFKIKNAILISSVMGTLFFATHHLPISETTMTAIGFIAPIIVSKWARAA